MTFFDLPMKPALDAYAIEKNPSLTDQLLYAILAQLDKANYQLGILAEKEKETE
jgi:hypothetical protein